MRESYTLNCMPCHAIASSRWQVQGAKHSAGLRVISRGAVAATATAIAHAIKRVLRSAPFRFVPTGARRVLSPLLLSSPLSTSLLRCAALRATANRSPSRAEPSRAAVSAAECGKRSNKRHTTQLRSVRVRVREQHSTVQYKVYAKGQSVVK